jgi:hypothetical protein
MTSPKAHGVEASSKEFERFDRPHEVLPGLPNPKYPPIEAITFRTRTTSKFSSAGYAVENPNANITRRA